MSMPKAAERERQQSLEKEVQALRARVRELEEERSDIRPQRWPGLSLHAIESLRDMVFWTRADSTFEYVNESACRALGYSRDELLGMGVGEIDPEFRLERWPLLWENLRQNGFIRLETTQRTKSGRLIPVEIMATFLTIEGEEMCCSVVREITDRRKAEEDLRESEARFRALFLNMAEGVALHRTVFDEHGVAVNYVILDVNPKYEEILGVKREDVVGKTGTEVYGTVDPPYLAEFSSVGNSGVPYVFETYFAPLDKHFQISVVSSGKGFFSTIFFDVSSHKKREAHLRERLLILTQPPGQRAAHRFEDFFEVEEVQALQDELAKTTGVSVLLVRPDGTLLTRPSLEKPSALSPSFLKRLEGLGPGAVIQRDDPLMTPNLKEPVFRAEWQGEPGDAVVGFWMEERHLASWLIGTGGDDGKTASEAKERVRHVCRLFFLIARRLSLLAWKNHQQSGLILQREQTEERIRRLNMELMTRNAELENIVQAGSRVLRTPLNNILGFCEMVRKDMTELLTLSQNLPLDDSRTRAFREMVEERIPRTMAIIHAGAGKMDSLLHGLLTFSELGQVAMRLEKINTRKLVDQVRKDLATTLQNAGTVVQVDELPDCWADRGMLQQVFTTLMDHAVTFRHPDRPLKIRLFGRIEDRMATFGVEDNGRGISPESHCQVWDLFQRLNADPETKGDGIGLALVRRIVERHHGRVFLESDGRTGSKLFFTIPNSPGK